MSSCLHFLFLLLLLPFLSNGSEYELPLEFQTHYYTQQIDHYNYKSYSTSTFLQKYIVNSKYWGGANAKSPVFVYFGGEDSIDNQVDPGAFLEDNAIYFKGLLVYIEHRYYGESMPFGSANGAFSNTSTLAYLSTKQALADYAELIINLKRELSADNCPVVVFGGSYAGTLFRLKYPHIACGALASSAPILYLDNTAPRDGYFTVVSRDFQEASMSCYTAIKMSWLKIDELGSEPNGLAMLSQIFKTCKPLSSAAMLKGHLESLYMWSAQYGTPSNDRINLVCHAIDGASDGSDTLLRVSAGLSASENNMPCNDIYIHYLNNMSAWNWQTCTEILVRNEHSEDNTMFQPYFINYTKECQEMYDVKLRPHWITTEFAGYDIKSVFRKFATNIIFSNGLHDPYSVGGIVENLSPTIVAIPTELGSHCLDLKAIRDDDPGWLLEQRRKEVEIIKGWLKSYYHEHSKINGIGMNMNYPIFIYKGDGVNFQSGWYLLENFGSFSDSKHNPYSGLPASTSAFQTHENNLTSLSTPTKFSTTESNPLNCLLADSADFLVKINLFITALGYT